jgi:hypothetical protein
MRLSAFKSPLFYQSSYKMYIVQYIQAVCGCGGGGGGGVLNCAVEAVEHILGFCTLFLTRFRTYKIDSPPQTKMTSKDDIKGL